MPAFPVLDPTHPSVNRGLASLDALAAQAALLEPPPPHELPHLWREEAAPLLDGLLVRVARGRGALDLAIGEGLAALSDGDRALQLAWSGIGDYGRERLGIAPRTAQELARLARGLRDRPICPVARPRAAHHLHGVHAGYLRVKGSAPDGLSWQLGAGRSAGGDGARA